MSYIDVKIRPRFQTLPNELQQAIMNRDVNLYTLNDLMRCLEEIISEG